MEYWIQIIKNNIHVKVDLVRKAKFHTLNSHIHYSTVSITKTKTKN